MIQFVIGGPGVPPPLPSTLVRGQWNQVGSGSYRTSRWRSDGTAKDAYGRLIPAGMACDQWVSQGTSDASSAFRAWVGNAWDTKHGQFLMLLSGGGTTSGFVTYDINVWDYATGLWNPTTGPHALPGNGRPQDAYSELAIIMGEEWPNALIGGAHGPALIQDTHNRYPTYTDPVPFLGGGRYLPNAAHTSGSICYMPSVDHLFIGPHYGEHYDDQGLSEAFIEYDIPARKYILDIAADGGADWPIVGGQSYTAWDSRRNLVWFLWDSAVGGFTKIASYDPASPLGNRHTVHQLNTFAIKEERFCSTLYDRPRDRAIFTGVFAPSFPGFNAIWIDCAHPDTPHPFVWPTPTGHSHGLIHDTVADRYIEYVNDKTLLSIHPDTLAVTDITPTGGVVPTSWVGPGTYHRFEWLKDWDDVYAVINTADDVGAWVFPPVRP